MGINLPFISKYDIVVKLFVASHVKTIMRYFEEYKNKSHSTMVEYVRLSEVSFKKKCLSIVLFKIMQRCKTVVFC